MASFNRVIIAGNLTKDPELRTTASGLAVCRLRLAITRVFKTQDGSQNKETTFVDVDCFGKQAETVARFFTKGKPILVEGRLKLDEWTNKDGEKRSQLVIVMESFTFVDSNRGETSDTAAAVDGENGQRLAAKRMAPVAAVREDDIPF